MYLEARYGDLDEKSSSNILSEVKEASTDVQVFVTKSLLLINGGVTNVDLKQ